MTAGSDVAPPPFDCRLLISSIRSAVALCATSSLDCLAVVTLGQTWRENGLSSKPAMDSSLGTSTSFIRAANRVPAAISSLQAKTAVGWFDEASKRFVERWLVRSLYPEPPHRLGDHHFGIDHPPDQSFGMKDQIEEVGYAIHGGFGPQILTSPRVCKKRIKRGITLHERTIRPKCAGWPD